MTKKCHENKMSMTNLSLQ